jgi:hypothetical protein
MIKRNQATLGLVIVTMLALFSPALGADRLKMSSTNPTALEIDQIRRKAFNIQSSRFGSRDRDFESESVDPELTLDADREANLC